MKIIATDFDGTLNYKGIDDVKRQAISEWRSKGNLFGVVSGRGLKSLLEVIEEKDFEYDYLIVNNGAIICDRNCKILKEYRCDGAIAKPFINDLFSWGCPFANIDKDVSIMIRADNVPCSEGEIHIEELPEIEYFNQINTMLDTYDEAAVVVDKIKEKYSNVLNPLQNGNCIDITPFGVNKASGIYSLLPFVGGKYEDVITVGDNVNDKDMIAEFKSYAMDNGVDLIKELADFTTLGITELINKELNLIEL